MKTSQIVLTFLGGVALGAATASVVSRGKLRPCAAKGLSFTYDLKDKIVAGIETIKEDCDDLVAEAKEQAELRKVQRKAAAKVAEEDIVEKK